MSLPVLLQAIALNVLIVLIAWFGRAYWLYAIERLVDVLQGQAARRRKNKFLADNFAPVSAELAQQDLKVIGALPKALDGVYARTGPNPVLPISGDYHWFDGDGMVHACRIKDGKVSYSNRLVHTNRLKRELKLGFPVYQRFGDMRGFWGVFHAGLSQLRLKLGVTPQSEGVGTANTALVFHAKKLLALHEGDLPYALRILCDGIVDTLGRLTFGDKVNHPFTAHPKVDPITGELFSIGYQIDKQPAAVWYAGLDKDGQLQFDVRVDLKEGVMMHDMAITQDYAILLDVPLVFRPEVMVTKDRLPLVYDKSRPARFGVLPKRPKSGKEVIWFELPPVMIFHVANAWQESRDVIKMFACCFEDFDLDLYEEDLSDSYQPCMREMTFNLATGEATTRQLADVVCEFPRVPDHLTGLKTRYAYAASMDESRMAGKFQGIVKMDLGATNGGAIAGRLSHGHNRWGGEAVFVSAGGPSAAEDDGYLMTFVHDESSNKSELVVYDSRTMSEEPVARVQLPQRVPYGFHGTHMSETQFQQQVVAL